MELISAKLHTSIGSFPSSSSLTGFLTSEDGVSPIQTYPVYVTKNIPDDKDEIHNKTNDSLTNNTLIILDKEYKIMHKIVINDQEIVNISCYKSKIAISTCSEIRVLQKFGDELRTLCILDEENIYNSCFFLDGNGLCICKKANKVILYNLNDLINRYHAQLDALETEKQKLKKRTKLSKGLESGATTPTQSVMSYNDEEFDEDSDSEIDPELIGDIINEVNGVNTKQDINALVVGHRTIYIETQKPPDDEKKNEMDDHDNDTWSISVIAICCTSSFWWIGMIDNFGVLHVCKLMAEWPSVSNLSDMASSSNPNACVVQLWRNQPSVSVSRENSNNNNNNTLWFIGMWTYFTNNNTNTQYISWYKLCDTIVLLMLDSCGVIHLWNEPSYNYILSSLSSYDSNKFIFRCILSIDCSTFVGFACIQNILCDSNEFATNVNNNNNDYIWLLTLDNMGNICVYFIQNIALFECGKASLIKFSEIEKGIIYRLGNMHKSLCHSYLFDTQMGVTMTSKFDANSNQIACPIMLQWNIFFNSGIFCHFINQKHVICNRMFGGILPNDPIVKFISHPSLRYNIFAVLSASQRLSIFDYSQNLDSINCNNPPSLIYVVPFEPILAFAWDQTYRRLICISQQIANNTIEYVLSVHVYKSKNGWFHVWEKPIRLNNKEKILYMIIAPYIGDQMDGSNLNSPFYHRPTQKSRRKSHKSKQPKSNMVIVAQETSWNGFMIELDKLARPYETRSDPKNKNGPPNKSGTEEKKINDSDTFHGTNLHSNPQILIHRRPYGELKAHRDRIRRRPPSQAPNSLYQWKKSDRRPAPLVVRSVKVDRELYGKQTSFSTEMLAAIIGEQYGHNKRLVSCSGITTNDRAVLICVFAEDKQGAVSSCACYTIFDNSKHVIQAIRINNIKITQSAAALLRSQCINASRIMLIHESEGIMLYEKESSSLNEWKCEAVIPCQDHTIKLLSMMKTAGGPCIATANHDLGSVQLLFPVLSDLSTTWNHDTFFREFRLHNLVMAALDDEKDIYVIQQKWPEKAMISALVFLSPTVLLVYRTDIEQWIIIRISTASVAGWPGRTLYHPLALYQDMKCTNFKRIHRILKDFLMVLRRVPEESYGSGEVRSRFLVPIKWLFDKDENKDSGISHLQFDASADYYLKPAEVREVHDLLQKIKLPMVSTTHTLTLLALTDTLIKVQQQQRNLDIPGAQFMFAANLFKLQRKSFVPLGCIAWAMHSDSQDALHDLCIPTQAKDISYETYKHLGIAYWLRNKTKLTKLIEKLAMAIYRKTRNPTEATLWYILLGKQRILCSLLKVTQGKDKVHKFMSRDFSEPRNQNAARSNAITLTSKHKYVNACAFWVLAGNYEPAINVALQHLDDPHLALLICRLLYQDKDDLKFDEMLRSKILPAVRNKFHNNAWEQHMLFWLLRQPQDAVNVFISEENNVCEMSDAPEIYAFVSYLKDNEIVKSVREREQNNNNNTSGNASAAIFASPIFDMFDMGDFDYASGTFKSKNDAKTEESDEKNELKKAFEPKAYDLASKVVTDKCLTDLLRRAAVSYSRCGMLVHSLEAVEQVIKRMLFEDEHAEIHSLQQLQSTLLWRFLCVRSTVMEHSHHIEPEQTKDDFADLSARFPKFDALLTLNYLYGECHLRGYMINSCNIPSGPTLTRLLIVLSRSISALSNIIAHRAENRFEILHGIEMLQFITKWEHVIDDLGLLGKERRIAIAAIAGIIHCGIFLKMYGLNRYDILLNQICKSNLSGTLQQIEIWYNQEKVDSVEFVDDEYVENIKYLQEDADHLWSNQKLAHGPIELLVVKTFRFVILERFIFLWRKLLKKIGLHASHFIDLGSLYTQFSSWLMEFAGDLQATYQMAIIYCQENKIENLQHTLEPLTKYNMFDGDDKTNDIYHKLEVDKIMQSFSEKIALFRQEHEEKKQEEKRDPYGYGAVPEENEFEKRINYNNDNLWYAAYDVFKIEGDLPATVSYNKCSSEWITIATGAGLREINIDCSLRFRLRSEDRLQLLDCEYDNFTDCLQRFGEIECPKHTEIFGNSPFAGYGSGDKRHCKPYSISVSNSNKINENAKPYPINPLLPRIQLKRLPNFLSSPQQTAMSSPRAKLKSTAASPPSLKLQRKPSEVYFGAYGIDDSKSDARSKYSVDKTDFKSTYNVNTTTIGNDKPEPAVTNTLQSNLLYGFSSYKLDVPLFYHCLDIAAIEDKRRSLSNTYRFYTRVISQQNKAVNNCYGSGKNNNKQQLQVSDKDIAARNEIYLLIAAHPSLPLYITANTKTDGLRLWHYHHQYPLASFSLPATIKNKTTHIHKTPQQTNKKKGIPSRSRNAKSEQKQNKSTTASPAQSVQKKVSSSADYMTALKFNAFGNKLCGMSQNGNLYLWHFNVPRSIFRREFRAYYSQHCHDKFGADLVFIRGSSCIATAGESTNNSNVCIWDLLFGERSRSLIRQYVCYEGSGANCIEYISSIDSIIVGGHKGILHMFDKRIPFPILKWEHGQSRIWRLSHFKATNELLVGTLEGHVSLWDVRKLYNKSTLYCSSTNTLAGSMDDSAINIMKFNDLTVPTAAAQGLQSQNPLPFVQSKSATDTPLQKTTSSDSNKSDGNRDEEEANGMNGIANRNHPTSLSYASLGNPAVTNYVKPIDLDNECIVNEWKLFQRKTFLNHTFGAASQLGYVASVGLTHSIWTEKGNILCTGSDGTVKYLRRKSKMQK